MSKMKKRGLFLTIMLFAVAYGYAKYLYFPWNKELTESIYGHYPDWFPLFSATAVAWGIPTVIGLWNWRLWAIYLLVISLAIGTVTVHTFFNLATWALIGYYTTIILLFLAIYPKWKHFR